MMASVDTISFQSPFTLTLVEFCHPISYLMARSAPTRTLYRILADEITSAKAYLGAALTVDFPASRH